MGEMADYYRDLWLEEMFNDCQEEHEYYEGKNYEEMIWVTREGKRILVKEMKDSHLQNTERFLRKRGLALTIQYLRIKEELKRRNLKTIK